MFFFECRCSIERREERGKEKEKKEERVGDEIDVMMDNNPSAFFSLLLGRKVRWTKKKKKRKETKRNER